MDQDPNTPDDGTIPPYVPPASPGTPPPDHGYPGVPPTAMPPGSFRYAEESQAVLSLVLSIVGIVVCGGLLSPVGWYLGNKELAGIDAGRRDPSKRDLAMAGKIVGIIGTLLAALAIVAFVGFMFLAVVLGTTA